MSTRRTVFAVGFLLVVAGLGAWAGNNQTPSPSGPLFDYQVNTLRANRVEIVDDLGRIRLILDVHRDKPCVTFYTEDGEPARVIVTGEGGVVVGE